MAAEEAAGGGGDGLLRRPDQRPAHTLVGAAAGGTAAAGRTEGGSLLPALSYDGWPFVDWGTLFRRTARRIRERFEPRSPEVAPHRQPGRGDALRQACEHRPPLGHSRRRFRPG
ncbi:hypothetical protein GCM10027074_31140 [Streptomyces deserti]